MKIELNLSKREAEAFLRAEMSRGWGVRLPLALQTAEFKMRNAVITAMRQTDDELLHVEK